MSWFNLGEPIDGEAENFTKATGDGRVLEGVSEHVGGIRAA